jgi:hypothetical protein
VVAEVVQVVLVEHKELVAQVVEVPVENFHLILSQQQEQQTQVEAEVVVIQEHLAHLEVQGVQE